MAGPVMPLNARRPMPRHPCPLTILRGGAGSNRSQRVAGSMVPRAIVLIGLAAGRSGLAGSGIGRPRRRAGCDAKRRSAAILVFAVGRSCARRAPPRQRLRFRADEWVTECGGSPGGPAGDCSITVPFWQTGDDGKGSFALVVMLETGNIGIVGQPSPVRAVLRIDRNPPIECRATRYCIFPTAQSLAAVRELGVGSLILIDVFTTKSHFAFSLTPKGYQAGIAQIRAWGYEFPAIEPIEGNASRRRRRCEIAVFNRGATSGPAAATASRTAAKGRRWRRPQPLARADLRWLITSARKVHLFRKYKYRP